MEKRKCYVLIVSRYFPATHPRAGEKTNFHIGIHDCLLNNYEGKKHTIRSNYELWKKRVDEVQKGKAYLSLRYWTGLPYRSKQVEFAIINTVGIEKISFCQEGIDFTVSQINDGAYPFSLLDVAKNDGLSGRDFADWFGLNKIGKTFNGAIIHFTNFRYTNKIL